MTDESGVVTAKKEPLLPRWLKTVLVFLGVFLFLLVGAWILLDITTRQDLNAVLADIEARGWPLLLDELYPEPIPDEDNAALVYDQAWVLDRQQTEVVSRVENLEAWRALTEEEQAHVREELASVAPVLALLHQAAQMKQCQFDLAYRDGYALLLPHLSRLRNSTRWKRTASIVALADGRTDEALRHWLDAMAMVRHQEGQKFLICELVRLACLSISTDTLEAMVQSGQLTDSQLAQADLALEGLDLRAGFADCLKGELVLAQSILTGSLPDFKSVCGYSGPSDPVELLFRLYFSPFARPWRQQDQARHLVLLKEGIELAEQPYADVTKQHRTWEQEVDGLQSWEAPLTAMLLPALTRASHAVAAGEARRDLARTALALERHRLKQGRYPEALTALTPDLLPQVLTDPFDGQPVRYVNDGTRVAVYSIGSNLQDEGGSEAPQSSYEGDIVFTLTSPPEVAEQELADE